MYMYWDCHVAKFKTCQFILGTDSPNLMLAKVSHYTVYYVYTIDTRSIGILTLACSGGGVGWCLAGA